MSIGYRIKQRRKELDLSQEELSLAASISQKQISRYENNESDPTGSNIASLAGALQVSADWLLGLSESIKQDLSEDELEVIRILRNKNPASQRRLVNAIKEIAKV